jgi:hypothetical protein
VERRRLFELRATGARPSTAGWLSFLLEHAELYRVPSGAQGLARARHEC